MWSNGNNSYQQGAPFYDESNGADHSSTVRRKDEENHVGRAVERPPLFSGILPSDYSGISATARVREFARGEMLYIEGDSVQQVLLLTSGSVKINQLGLSGTEVILRISYAGDVLGAVDLCSTGRHCTTAQAFRLCGALVWDAPLSRPWWSAFPFCTRTWFEFSVGTYWNSRRGFVRWPRRELLRGSPVRSCDCWRR